MKKMILTVSALFFIVITAKSEDPIEKKYSGMIAIENKRHAKEMAKIHKLMLRDYDVLLKKYMKSGKLEEANEISKKITHLKSQTDTKPKIKPKSSKKNEWIIGKWRFVRGRSKLYYRTFDEQGICTLHNGQKVPYKVTGKDSAELQINGKTSHIKLKDGRINFSLINKWATRIPEEGKE